MIEGMVRGNEDVKSVLSDTIVLVAWLAFENSTNDLWKIMINDHLAPASSLMIVEHKFSMLSSLQRWTKFLSMHLNERW